MKRRMVWALSLMTALGISPQSGAQQKTIQTQAAKDTLYKGRAVLPTMAEGRVDPRASAGSPVPYVQKLLVKEGDRVKKGQEMVELAYLEGFDAMLKNSVKQNRALVTSAEAVLGNAHIQAKRLQSADTATARFELDRARFAVQKATSDLIAAKLALDNSILNATPFNPIAPRDGIVRSIKVREGAAAVAFTDGTPWMMVVDDTSLEVTVQVPRKNVDAYQPGRPIRIHCPAIAHDTEGTVIRITPETSVEGTVPVTLEVPNPNRKIFMGDILVATPLSSSQ